MSSFVKRFLLPMVLSKLSRYTRGHGHNRAVTGLLREVERRLGRRHGHGGPYGHYGHGHHGYHGHYRRKRRW